MSFKDRIEEVKKELKEMSKNDKSESSIPIQEQILYTVKGDSQIAFEKYEKIVENFKKRFMLQATLKALQEGYDLAKSELPKEYEERANEIINQLVFLNKIDATELQLKVKDAVNSYQTGYSQAINKVNEIIDKEVKLQLTCQECGKRFGDKSEGCEECNSYDPDDLGQADDFLELVIRRIKNNIKRVEEN